MVPEALPEGILVPIWKNKGSKDDYATYRFICLLNSTYKILSAYLLLRMVKATDWYLSQSQAGFRKGRACRDNVYVLSQLIDFSLVESRPLIVSFIDYVSAFDTVSHRFLGQALEEAGAEVKIRAVFQAIYESATARVRVRLPGSREERLCDRFPVDRGVVQGDISSPWCFIMAVECLMRRSYCGDSGGASLMETFISKLEYADDAALIDEDHEAASERLTLLEVASWSEADMVISRPKTKVMNVRKVECGGHIEKGEYDEVAWSHGCQDCDRGFDSKDGLTAHRARHCSMATETEWEVEEIVDVRGSPEERFFRV